ncbi:hypothetical protein [Galbibacter mesophilus]|uniref:hypothetical protein n=1 Tax=Galbibacter mesophilus TaxID=379069 RepID=UPI00191CF7F8|nr:hypothetical protein [Galbibacter mesophilus]MCM5663624.1 hypothetical protein [Galbibacter mesophilus]
MRILLWIIAIIFNSIFCFAQFELESEVFRVVLADNAMNKKIYISCEKPRTRFEYLDFNESSGLEVPIEIIEELNRSSEKSRGGSWDSIFPLKSELASDYLKSEKCISKDDIDSLMIKKNYDTSIFNISEPIFDEKFEHCIVSFTCIRPKGSAYGSSYFLKKVYGSWIVIAVFDSWIS